MISSLFFAVHRYAWVLETAGKLLKTPAAHGEEVSKVEYQINTRIYNNAFCGLIRNGYPFAYDSENGDFLSLLIDGSAYRCPSNSVKNILREEYQMVCEGKALSSAPSWTDFDFNDSKPVEKTDDIAGIGEPEESIEIPIIETNEVEVQEIVEPLMKEAEVKPKFQPKNRMEVNESVLEKPEPIASITTSPINSTGSEEEISINARRGIFARFRGLPEANPLTPATEKGFLPRGPLEQPEAEPVVIGTTCSDMAKKIILSEIEEKRDYSHDGGGLFQHMHRVTLQKMYGSSVSGPYRFVLWPTIFVEKVSGKVFADFLLHVTDPNGNEYVHCTDENCKEISVNVDGREFNVFGTWVNGELETHVTLRGKTASMFTIEDDVHIMMPKEAIDDNFFEQFRLERKGQPKHFIVPFKDNNRGERMIPIIGYVEVNRKKYPLERREGNTLRYKISGNGEKIISGHWEENRFIFTVDAANRIV